MRLLLGQRLGASTACIFVVASFVGACSAPPTVETIGQSSQAIVNGTDSNASQNFVVLVVHPISESEYYNCSGSLVAPNLVLTARHCVSQTEEMGFTCDSQGNGSSGGTIGADFKPSTLQIFAGLERPNVATAVPNAVGVQIFHDTATNLCNHDLALIGLNQPITGEGIQVPSLRLGPAPSEGEAITAVGWGVYSESASPSIRQQRTNVTILNIGPHSDPEGNDVPPNEFDDGESICEGDSGSPALDSTNAIIGVASRGGNNTTPNAADLAASCEGADTLNYYSQLGPFSSTILNAFVAMHATPNLVGGVTLGQPCTTEFECASKICVTSDSSGYCSESCASTTCPSGYFCGGDSGAEVCEQDLVTTGGGCGLAPGWPRRDDLVALMMASVFAIRRRRRTLDTRTRFPRKT